MKALGIVVSDKKIFENCILKTNWNNLNNFGRGPPRDDSCEVSSKSNELFQRRRCLSKKVYARRTTTDDGQRPVTIAHHEHFVFRLAKTMLLFFPCRLIFSQIRLCFLRTDPFSQINSLNEDKFILRRLVHLISFPELIITSISSDKAVVGYKSYPVTRHKF